MSAKVKIGKKVEIDPGLLFQRLLVLSHAATYHQHHQHEVFQHELCGYPPFIFESPTLLRKANKPQIILLVAEAGLETTAPSPLASPATISAIIYQSLSSSQPSPSVTIIITTTHHLSLSSSQPPTNCHHHHQKLALVDKSLTGEELVQQLKDKMKQFPLYRFNVQNI